ncbi:MAG TPA: SAM-dependent methyltransferase [Bdellovibrionales bacterium]|nr:SAM-dependent methyltransferase [Bdellovibrionales bacterium]HCM40360.1 SAM-dependent methyltransferase [Bdellovibrionales bacterium]
MLPFDPANPYPLVAADSHTYTEAQKHSAEVDHWLGLHTEEIESSLIETIPATERKALWIGLPVRSLLTPYTEIRTILELLKPATGDSVIDLGAGYGRMGFVIGEHYPETSFTGFERVVERVTEANRCLKLKNISIATMIEADLSSASQVLPPAAYYFIYDYSIPDAIQKTLDDLKRIAQKQKITVVGRGRSARDIIEQQNPWLSQIVRPEHTAHFSIYRSQT